jgi:hypothetical protein
VCAPDLNPSGWSPRPDGAWGITAETIQDAFGFVRNVVDVDTSTAYTIRETKVELVLP